MTAKVYNAVGAVANQTEISPIDPQFNQLFVTAKYFSDSSLNNEVTPTGGTIAIQGRPYGAGGFSTLSMSPLDCTDTGDFGSSSVPLDALRFIPASIAGATHYQITATAKDE